MEEMFLHALSNVGVPAALCFYTLFEVNKNVKRLADSIDRLDVDLKTRVSRLEDAVAELKRQVRETRFVGKDVAQ